MQSIRSAKVFGDREDPRVRLHALFGGELPAGGQPPHTALEWADATLSRAGGASRSDIVVATRELRAAEPRLTLRAATFLATHATSGTFQ